MNAEKVEKGSAFDLVTLAPAQFESMKQSGKLVQGKGGLLAKAGTGVAVKRGSDKPRMSTLEEFRATLLNVRGIGLNDPKEGGPSGINALALFERLGISEAVRPKLKFTRNARETTKALVSGEIDIGIAQVGQILADPELDLVAPFPLDAQRYTELMGGISSGSQAQDAVDELLVFLRSPEARRTLAQSGLEID